MKCNHPRAPPPVRTRWSFLEDERARRKKEQNIPYKLCTAIQYRTVCIVQNTYSPNRSQVNPKPYPNSIPSQSVQYKNSRAAECSGWEEVAVRMRPLPLFPPLICNQMVPRAPSCMVDIAAPIDPHPSPIIHAS